MIACGHSEYSLELVTFLIEKFKADPQFVCESGTPFIAAIDANQRPIVEYFIKSLGYDVNKTDA
jgi:hypothetical protein